MLFFYNVFSSILWSIVLYTSLFDNSYSNYILLGVQLFGIMDPILAALKIIKSNPAVVALQTFAKIGVLCLVGTKYLSSLGVVWSLSEISRFGYMAVKSNVLFYLRYNTFWVVYPIGMIIELVAVLTDRLYIKNNTLLDTLFVGMYFYFGPIMYNHMVKLNRSQYMKYFLENLDKNKMDNSKLIINFGNYEYTLDYNNIDILKKQIENIIPKSAVRYIETIRDNNQKEIFVKDLGLQVPWIFVFIVEYIGPVIISSIIYSINQTHWNIPFILHFVKRVLETIFVHNFSKESMPIGNLFKNSLYYWGASYFICSTLENSFSSIQLVGLMLWVYAEIMNYRCHLYLSGLRSNCDSIYGLPTWYPFRYTVCPNYSYEILGWILFSLNTNNIYSLIFTILGAVQMYFWAVNKRKRYRVLFDDKYKVSALLIPGIL